MTGFAQNLGAWIKILIDTMAETKKAETKQNPYQMDLLTEDWKLHKPSSGNIDFGLGIGSTAYGSAFGQQPVFYRRSGKAPGFPF